MNRPARTRLRRRLLLLAAALLFVQVLGLMHAVLHDHARTGVRTAAVASPLGRHADGSIFDALIGAHDSQADCDQFDHITHLDPAWFDAPAFALHRAEPIEVAVHAGWHIAPQAAGFLARGPPSQA